VGVGQLLQQQARLLLLLAVGLLEFFDFGLQATDGGDRRFGQFTPPTMLI
jgi:hypothetical protein